MDTPTLRLIVRAIRLVALAVMAQAGGYPDRARGLAVEANRSLDETGLRNRHDH